MPFFSFIAVVWLVSFSAATASRSTGSALVLRMAGQPSTNPIDVWLTKPNPIDLTPDQRKKLDSIKVEYATERKKAIATELGNEMGIVIQVNRLDVAYGRIVRAQLTPSQQALFDKNLDANHAPR